MNNDLRWKQRFQNFEKAINVFQNRIDDSDENPENSDYYEALQMALVQSFEIVFELAWKLLKDFLEDEGYTEAKSPKSTLKQAFQIEIIRDAEVWMEALEKRNITTHTYDSAILKEVVDYIKNKFAAVVWDLYHNLKKEL